MARDGVAMNESSSASPPGADAPCVASTCCGNYQTLVGTVNVLRAVAEAALDMARYDDLDEEGCEHCLPAEPAAWLLARKRLNAALRRWDAARGEAAPSRRDEA